MEGRLKGKVAVVTGSASGIGLATVQRFAREGAHVIASDLNHSALDMVASSVRNGQSIVSIPGDVTKRDDTEQVVEQAVAHFGKLDILVNSAGITSRTIDPKASLEARWEAVMNVNAKGTMLMCHAAIQAMRKTGGGSIINIASIMGLVGYPLALPFPDGFAPYPHSKGAVVQMTRDMGVRFAREGIRINAICPGFVYTALTDNVTQDPETHETLRDLHPIGRMAEPDEIANVITFLASDEASFVAAAVWPVDGGYTAT